MLDDELMAEIENDLPEDLPHVFISAVSGLGIQQLVKPACTPGAISIMCMKPSSGIVGAVIVFPAARGSG